MTLSTVDIMPLIRYGKRTLNYIPSFGEILLCEPLMKLGFCFEFEKIINELITCSSEALLRDYQAVASKRAGRTEETGHAVEDKTPSAARAS